MMNVPNVLILVKHVQEIKITVLLVKLVTTVSYTKIWMVLLLFVILVPRELTPKSNLWLTVTPVQGIMMITK